MFFLNSFGTSNHKCVLIIEKAVTLISRLPQIQIGCQTDYLRDKTLKRAPSVCRNFPVISEKMQVSNLWGGLIYLVAPPNAKVEGAEVIVQMAVAAPYYKSGECVSVRTLMYIMQQYEKWEFNEVNRHK